MSGSIAAHQKNLTAILAADIREVCEALGLAPDKTFSRVAALGYDLPDFQFIDGAGDKGIDFWFQSDTGFDIFQAKTHELQGGTLDLSVFDDEGIKDLQRAKNFLLAEVTSIRNEGLKQLRHRWEHAIGSRRGSPDRELITVNLSLVILGTGLTTGADQDFAMFRDTLTEPSDLRGVPVQFTLSLYTIDDLITRRWQEDNRTWRDIAGSKKDYIDLHPEDPDSSLTKKGTAVFYCRAYDLVRAYQEFGYQLFEPNVRCNIKVSKVNAAIRESVQTRLGREEFRFLNNGVTIVCKSYSKPSANRPAFRVTEPGIVNGLQTVFALHEAYLKLRPEDKDHFEKSCYVLVRLLQEQTVNDVSRMVRATNTQNPMQPRNLMSNNSEQILFERLFAELGWFYERKQGAWDAYAADPRRWRTLHGKTKENFQYSYGAGRPRVRCVDNELLAQCWLSFVGFSEEANHSKASIFENDQWYDFIFLHSPAQPGVDFGYNFQEARENSKNEAPAPPLMLASYLAREFQREVVPSQRENYESALKRLGIDPARTPREQIELKLSEDTDYVLGQVLSGMSLLFVEFFGLLLSRSVPADIDRIGPELLRNCSLGSLQQKLNFEEVALRVNQVNFEPNDVLAVSWCAFKHCVEELVGTAWLTEYRQARSRNRFAYSVDTRARLQKSLNSLHQYTQRTQLTRPWAVGIVPPDGLFGNISRSILRKAKAQST